MNSSQMSLFSARPGGPVAVPPGDFAPPSLVDRGFVERSVETIRSMPDAERQLRADMAEHLESIGAIDLVYRGELNEWAATTRERLWQEYFTADAMLSRLTSRPVPSEVGQ